MIMMVAPDNILIIVSHFKISGITRLDWGQAMGCNQNPQGSKEGRLVEAIKWTNGRKLKKLGLNWAKLSSNWNWA